MKNIKLGLKLWSSNYDLLKEANNLILENTFDYIELKVVLGTEYKLFDKLKIPYIIHSSSEINIADKDKERDNIKMINQCLEWKNWLNAKYLILHPGFGSLNNAMKILNKLDDEDIIIENMPKIGTSGEKMVGYNSEQIKKMIGDKFGFCLDFNHAVKAALSLNKNYKSYIRDLLKLNPKVCHISDGILKNKKDEHLDIGKGEYDLEYFCKCIKRSSIEYITMETPKWNIDSLENDIVNVKELKSVFSSIKS